MTFNSGRFVLPKGKIAKAEEIRPGQGESALKFGNTWFARSDVMSLENPVQIEALNSECLKVLVRRLGQAQFYLQNLIEDDLYIILWPENQKDEGHAATSDSKDVTVGQNSRFYTFHYPKDAQQILAWIDYWDPNTSTSQVDKNLSNTAELPHWSEPRPDLKQYRDDFLRRCFTDGEFNFLTSTTSDNKLSDVDYFGDIYGLKHYIELLHGYINELEAKC